MGRIKNIFEFLGPSAGRSYILGAGLGMVVSFVELGFVLVIQLFLITTGLMPKELNKLPQWFPIDSPKLVFGFVFLMIVFRAFIQWALALVNIYAVESQKEQQRKHLVKWALYSESASGAEVTTRYNDQCGAVATLTSQVLALFTAGITSFILIVALLKISFTFTLVLVAAMAVVSFATKKIDPLVLSLGSQAGISAAKIHGGVLRNAKNLLLIQIYGTQKYEDKSLQQLILKNKELSLGYQKLAGFKHFGSQGIGVLLICGVAVVMGKYKLIEPSLILSFFYLFLRLVQNLSEVLRAKNQAYFVWPQASLFYQWWEQKAKAELQKVDSEIAVKDESQFVKPIGWVLENVSFNYHADTPKVINDLSLLINPGSFVAISGPSGVGKSTLVHLLLGQLIPTQGRLRLIDDKGAFADLFSQKGKLLKSIGYVGPESFMIEGTVYENLCYGLTSPPNQEDVKRSLKLAECDFVYQLPLGLEHKITEQGKGLSAGQKQRLSLARAYLRNPQVLILDEATSNLDFETENRVLDTIKRQKSKLTIISVSHRSSHLELADIYMKFSESGVEVNSLSNSPNSSQHHPEANQI